MNKLIKIVYIELANKVIVNELINNRYDPNSFDIFDPKIIDFVNFLTKYKSKSIDGRMC